MARQARQKRLRLLGIAGAAAVLVAAILIAINMQGDDSSSGEDIDFASIPQNGNTLGNEAATVTIVEYADYQCPWCGKFATEDFPQIVRDYVATGEVMFEFRAHPFLGGSDLTSPNNESVQAAVAAECAGDQGKFWEYNHALFENQDGENQGAFSSENLQRIAEDVGLDVSEFDSCMESQTHLQPVIDQLTANQAEGVTTTPTILINGVQVAYTADGYSRLQEQINAALEGKAIPQ